MTTTVSVFTNLKRNLGTFAKDIKLNLSSVLSEEGAPGLTANQIAGIALSSAYATRQGDLVAALIQETSGLLNDSQREGAKAATSIMAMNNVYYRFVHLVGDKDFSALPASLRMSVIGNPPIHKGDFELYCLAVSAVNGCGMCMKAHAKQLTEEGISKLGIQSCIRIAAVINAAAQSIEIQQLENSND